MFAVEYSLFIYELQLTAFIGKKILWISCNLTFPVTTDYIHCMNKDGTTRNFSVKRNHSATYA